MLNISKVLFFSILLLFVMGCPISESSSDTYTVTYDLNGATSGVVPADSGKYEEGQVTKILNYISKPIKGGSTFIGWNSKADGTGVDYAVNSSLTFGTSNVILYAKWALQLTVTYDLNGATSGEVLVDSGIYKENQTTTVLNYKSLPNKIGYIFHGWNTKKDGTGENYFAGDKLTVKSSNITLYCKWIPKLFTVTYNLNGATSGEVPIDSGIYEAAEGTQVLDYITEPKKAGYVFKGWNTEADGTGVDKVKGNTLIYCTSNVVLYSKWAPIFTLTYDLNGEISGEVPIDNGSYEENQTTIILDYIRMPTKLGYKLCWNTKSDGTGQNYAAGDILKFGTLDVTLYCKWYKAPIMVLVEGGTFQMGSEAGGSFEKPVHSVTISKDFYIGKYEVTQKLWSDIMGYNPSGSKGNNLPVEMIDWYEAVKFCNKLSSIENLTPAYLIDGLTVSINCNATGYRLPTEAQWEFAARGGNSSLGYTYSGSNSENEVAWLDYNSLNKTHEVGLKKANELGIHDMSGNVTEWCYDWYELYTSESKIDPVGISRSSWSTSHRIRGGGYGSSDFTTAVYFRGDSREAHLKHKYIGFRLVLPVQ